MKPILNLADLLYGTTMNDFWFGGNIDNSTVNIIQEAEPGVYTAQFLAPGFDKSEITVETSEKGVMISAEKKKEDRKFVLRGFYRDKLNENIVFKKPISVTHAELKDGILTLKITTSEAKRQTITVV